MSYEMRSGRECNDDEQSGFGYVVEPSFRRHRHTRREQRGAKLVSTLVVLFAVIVGIGFVTTGKAFGSCVMPDGTHCSYPAAARWANHKFHKGKMGRSHFRFTDYGNPVRARRMLVRKVRHLQSAGKVPSLAATASASALVRQALLADNCVGGASYAPYSTGFNLCKWHSDHGGVSSSDIKKIGQVGFCAGTLYFTYQTVGLGSALVFQGSFCGFQLWLLW
jgi:hypothetical protein